MIFINVATFEATKQKARRLGMFAGREVGKREFIQHTSKYIKWVEEEGRELVITHNHKPDMVLMKIKQKSLKDLQGLTNVKVHGDINEPVLPGFDQW